MFYITDCCVHGKKNNSYDSDSDHTNKKSVSMGHCICSRARDDGVTQLPLPQILHFRVKPRCSICMFFALHRILMICKEKNIVTL